MMGEYDAGYENYIDGLHREIIDYQIEVEQVKAENSKLVMKLNAEHLARQNVERENAKLRELVRDMYACIKALCSMVENSPGCSMCLTNQDEEKPCAAADVYCRMRELGVDA